MKTIEFVGFKEGIGLGVERNAPSVTVLLEYFRENPEVEMQMRRNKIICNYQGGTGFPIMMACYAAVRFSEKENRWQQAVTHLGCASMEAFEMRDQAVWASLKQIGAA